MWKQVYGQMNSSTKLTTAAPPSPAVVEANTAEPEMANSTAIITTTSKPAAEIAGDAEVGLTFVIGQRYGAINTEGLSPDAIIKTITVKYQRGKKAFLISMPKDVTEWLVGLEGGLDFATPDGNSIHVTTVRAALVHSQNDEKSNPLYVVTLRPKAHTAEAQANEAARESIEQALTGALADCDLVVTAVRRATNDIGAGLCLYYGDFEIKKGGFPWDKMYLATGTRTKNGNYIRIKFKAELLAQRGLCKTCMVPHVRGCNCNITNEGGKRDFQTRDAKASKKAATAAAMAAANPKK